MPQMKINLFWREFVGVHLVLLAALIGVIVAIGMRRADRIRRFGAACSAIFQSAGIVLFCVWLSKSDWLFWHRQGPPGLLFSVLACSVFGLAAFLVSWVLSAALRDGKKRTPRVLPIVLAVPSLLVVSIGACRLPRALQGLRLRHIDAPREAGCSSDPAARVSSRGQRPERAI